MNTLHFSEQDYKKKTMKHLGEVAVFKSIYIHTYITQSKSYLHWTQGKHLRYTVYVTAKQQKYIQNP